MAHFCIDIGNTHTHFGIVSADRTLAQSALPTRRVDDPTTGIAPAFWSLVAEHGAVEGISFCSVVPAATPLVRRVLELQHLKVPIFQLTHDVKLGVGVSYPNPPEIGQDRLANAIAAHLNYGSPAIVIDLGTAVTFDVITQRNGYEGGVIAPGVDIMRRYMHERTAQLPLLDDNFSFDRPIGRSTLEAMRIATVIGFAGMIQAILDAILKDLQERGEPVPRVLSTGGAAHMITGRIRPEPISVPDLTLHGLAAAYRLNAA